MDTQLVAHPPWVRSLLAPAAYPHPVARIELLQTHASLLFFTGDQVYKVKKPVDFGFLDFSTLQKRRRFCRLEVALNRRLSPGVYLGVAEIRRTGDCFRVGTADGEVVEYAVRMRQLPRGDALSERLAAGRADAADVRRVAAKLAAFHQTAEIVAGIDVAAVVEEKVLGNLRDLGKTGEFRFPAEDLSEQRAYARGFLRSGARIFGPRLRDGRVRDGHGDLHAANIFLCGDDVKIIDCIEFNPAFRRLDVAEDVAFLAMDLDHFGRPDLGREFVAEYVRLSGDGGVVQLLDFFKVYRALVRAKVSRLLAADGEIPDPERRRHRRAARAYFGLANDYLKAVRPLPAVIAVGGMVGAGKSTLSRCLAERWGMLRFSSDLERKRLAGIPPGVRRYESYGEGLYSPKFTSRTYRRMLDKTREALAAGLSVALDASFLREEDRRAALEIARRFGVDFRFVECRAREDVLLARLRRRETGLDPTISDGRAEILHEQKKRREPPDCVPAGELIEIDTGTTPQAAFETLLEELYKSK